jgi:hypothetical protein
MINMFDMRTLSDHREWNKGRIPMQIVAGFFFIAALMTALGVIVMMIAGHADRIMDALMMRETVAETPETAEIIAFPRALRVTLPDRLAA